MHAARHAVAIDPRLRALVARALTGAEVVRVVPLKADTTEHGATAKGAGYGAPLRLDVRHEGRELSLVLHCATPNAFGHERRADRAAEMLVAADTFALLPHHTRVLDVGAFRGDGFVSLGETGEFYLLTDYAEGRPYAADLRRIAQACELEPSDALRVDELVRYLLSIHSIKLPQPSLYKRSIRDLLGSGEGIFGIIDSYPDQVDGVDAGQLSRIESLCLSWRWRLKDRYRRLVRIHGDFHPFNVLFGDDSRLILLDASRGCAGDAADDVAAMAVNFVFFSNFERALWGGTFRELWYRFWALYLELSHDWELLDVVAPFLAWRGLVLASPVWYPDLGAGARSRLLDFIQTTLEAPRFDPESVERLFAH
jgi:aminoglycoside phosphotransferase (APT) family kinase protein